MSNKTCTKCKKFKKIKYFTKDKYNKDGYTTYCKICRNLNRRIFHNKNKDKENKRNRQYYTNTKLARKNAKLKYKYGISLEDYNNLLAKQNNVCYICKLTEDQKQLAVDHCHTTGKVRGLLCGLCNTGLGSFRDNITFLKTAIKYIKENK